MFDAPRGSAPTPEVVLRVDGLHVTLGHGVTASPVLKGVNLTLRRGESIALVGESGSGKSTLAKAIVGIHRAGAGRIEHFGRPAGSLRRVERRRVQLIPQDPYSSLDPRRTIAQTLAEALDPLRANVRTSARRERITEALAWVAMDASALARYPHEFSGGQRQRIAIARALLADPVCLIADEITSALDVSTQAEVLELLRRLQREKHLSMIFITHNLAIIGGLCERVVVLLHGEVVEQGPVDEVFRHPASRYTRTLLESVPGTRTFTLTERV